MNLRRFLSLCVCVAGVAALHAQTQAQTPAQPASVPQTAAANYAVLPFAKFAPNLQPVLNPDGTPKTIWYRADVAYMETTDAPPQGAGITSVPKIPDEMLADLPMHHFAPLLGTRYVYTDFLWIDRNPVGKLIAEPIPYGTVFYLAIEKEKDNFLDIQVYYYATENLRWEDASKLNLKNGELDREENFLPRPDLRHMAEKVSVKLGNWTLFLVSKRVERSTPSGGLIEEKNVYGYLILRIRPTLTVRPAAPEAAPAR